MQLSKSLQYALLGELAMWGRLFKVELLSAYALPCHLLSSLKAILSSNDPVLLEAGSTHLRHIADHLDFLQGIKFPEKEAELKEWINRSRQDWLSIMDSDDLDKPTYIAWQVDAYQDACVLLNSSFFSVV